MHFSLRLRSIFRNLRFTPTALMCLGFALMLPGCEFYSGRDGTGAKAAEGEAGVADTRINRIDATAARRDSRSAGSSGGRTSTRRADSPTTEPLVQISGTVRFESGQPITTATVELWQTGITVLGHYNNEQRLDVSPVGPEGRYSVTGADGTGLSLEVKGASRALCDIKPVDNTSTVPRVRRLTQDFILPAPHTIRGRVVDATDTPLTSAIVSVRTEDTVTDGWYYGSQQTTVTAAGEFELTAVATGNAIIGATAPGMAPAFEDISVPTSGPVTLRLSPANSGITGHVVMYPDDRPVAGARVSIRPTGKVSALKLSQLSAVTDTTAASGAFTIKGLPAGSHQLAVTNTDGSELYPAPDVRPTVMSPTLAANETTAITLRVFPGYTIAGTVFDKETSEPIAGVPLRVYSSNIPGPETRADESGGFRLSNVAPNSITLGIGLDGYTIATESTAAGGRMRVPSAKDTDSIHQDVPVIPVVIIGGRVENRDGLPVANADVEWQGSLSSTMKTLTDGDGRFQFQLQPFQSGVLEVEAEGYAFHRTPSEVQVNAADRDDITIILDREATVAGRVVDSSGKGIPEASVSPKDSQFYRVGAMMRSGTRKPVTTDADGKFLVRGLAPGKNMLEARAKGYSHATTNVELAQSEHKVGVEIQLADELTIEGRVLGEDDEPIKANVYPQAGGGSLAQTDSDGAFKLGGLKPGKVSLYVSAFEPYESDSIEATAGTKDLIVRLKKRDQITVRCHVIDKSTRQPVVNLTVGNVPKVQTAGEPAGTFRFTASAGFRGRVEISAEGYPTQSFPIEVPKDAKEYETTLEMGAGAGVRGRVVSVAGEPLADVPVAGYDNNTYSARAAGQSVSDAEGKFLIMGLPGGEVNVMAMPAPPLTRSSKVISVTDGNVADIGDITVGEPGAITGQIVYVPGGAPASGQYVDLRIAIDNGSRTSGGMKQSDAEGRFAFGELSAGSYALSGGFGRVPVELKAGETKELTLEVGAVTMQGFVTKGGAPTAAVITLRNLQTSRGFSANPSSADGRYIITNVLPGTYEARVQLQPGKDEASIIKMLDSPHTEQMTVPAQKLFQKDFVLP